MISFDTSRGRHRLVETARRPALLPRSATVVAATVGVVLGLGAQDEVKKPVPPPSADLPVSALQPVVPDPRDGRAEPVPAALHGRAIAGAHPTGSAVVPAPRAVPGVVGSADAPRTLFAA